MDSVKERVAYLRGLVEGLDVAASSPEGRVLAGVVEVLDAMVSSFDQLQIQQEQTEDYLMAIDEDLTELETDFYESAYDDEITDEYEWEDEDAADLTELGYIQMQCPKCEENVYVDQDIFEDDDVVEVLCPECHQTILINENYPMASSADRD